MVRYADDFVILCRTPEEAEKALATVRQWVETKGLTLHPEKTHIVDVREASFSFLGYSFRGKAPLSARKEPPKVHRPHPRIDPGKAASRWK